MSELPRIGPGSEVLMHYRITLEDGMVADRSEPDAPLRFTMGDGTLIEGLERVLYGLHAGDRESLRLDPEEAFGLADEENVHSVPRDDFPPEITPEPGLIVSFSTPSGEEVPGAVREVGSEEVRVDFNHPLAGHEIGFSVEILEVIPPAGVDTADEAR